MQQSILEVCMTGLACHSLVNAMGMAESHAISPCAKQLLSVASLSSLAEDALQFTELK